MIYDNDSLILQMADTLSLSGRSSNTISTYTHAISLLCRFSNKPSCELTAEDAYLFIINLHKQGTIAKTTINCYNSCCRYFFDTMLDITISKHKIPFFKTKYKPIFILTDSQIKLFLDAVSFDPRLSALYMVAYTCGLRISEVRNLQVFDIDTTAMTVHIAPSKGGKERTVHLCHDTHMALRAYSSCYHLKKDNYLFAIRNGKRPALDTIRNAFKEHLVLAGLDSSTSFHIFRHTIATNLLANGSDPFSVMTFLGHSSLGATSRYMHLAQLKKKTYAPALDATMEAIHHV